MMMKKIVLITSIFLAFACHGNDSSKSNDSNANSKANVANAAPPVVKKTLDGVDSAVAKAKIDSFEKNYQSDVRTKSVCVWYNKDQIKVMYDLLIAEEKTKKADGVRIYLGCEPRGGSAKLKLSIFLISTKPQNSTYVGQSEHGDYYDHETTLLTTPTEEANNDDDALAFQQGAKLYDATVPAKDTCIAPDKHYLNVDTAYARVQKLKKMRAAFNTKSEWFDMCFIKGIFEIILADKINGLPNNIDGLRIYLGNGFKDEKKMERDVFVLVPTTKTSINTIHADFYRCLEDLSAKPFCTVPGKAFIYNPSKLYPLAAYDKGELCPNSCN